MPLDDDELGALLRRVDPAVTAADMPLTAKQLALRDRITGESATEKHRKRPLLWSTVLPALAIAVITLVVIFNFSAAPKAVAMTPPPLTFSSTSQTAGDVLKTAEKALMTTETEQATRSAQATGWYAQMAANAEGEVTSSAIAPQVTTIDWAPDQSGRIVVVAGEPYWADGSTNPVPARDAPRPGTVLQDSKFTAGGLGAPSVEPPGDSLATMKDWLVKLGLPADADAADVIDAINTALTYWTLTNEQHALLLRLLLDRPDVTVLGTGKDRADRPVTGIAADSHRFPGTRKLLLISAENGRIIAEEVMRTTPSGSLPAGSVMSYTLWGLPRK